jgi:hypothetical protein
MRKIITIIFLLVGSINLYGQEDTYPRYYIQNGDTLGVIYSIDQVQKIYNDQVLLSLFKDMRIGCDSLMKKYLVIVNEYEQKQLVDKSLIEQYEKERKNQEQTNQTYLTKIDNLEKDSKKCDDQKGLKDGQIKDLDEVVKQLRKERNWLIGGTIGFGTLGLFLLGSVLGN